MEISQYARKNAKTIKDVWHQVRSGQLMARMEGSEFHVFELNPESFQELPETDKPGATAAGTPRIAKDLPPSSALKSGATAAPAAGTRMAAIPTPDPRIAEATERELPPVSDMSLDLGEEDTEEPVPGAHSLPTSPTASNTEVALLLDHLSLAKEENREILRLTQDSIAKITQMAETMMAMKDEILRQRTEELLALRQALADKEQLVSRLRQEVEDFNILTKTLGE